MTDREFLERVKNTVRSDSGRHQAKMIAYDWLVRIDRSLILTLSDWGAWVSEREEDAFKRSNMDGFSIIINYVFVREYWTKEAPSQQYGYGELRKKQIVKIPYHKDHMTRYVMMDCERDSDLLLTGDDGMVKYCPACGRVYHKSHYVNCICGRRWLTRDNDPEEWQRERDRRMIELASPHISHWGETRYSPVENQTPEQM